MKRGAKAGEVQLLDGYFVHFTAPENLTPIPIHVVFVLDTSGSMRHRQSGSRNYSEYFGLEDLIRIPEWESTSIINCNRSLSSIKPIDQNLEPTLEAKLGCYLP